MNLSIHYTIDTDKDGRFYFTFDDEGEGDREWHGPFANRDDAESEVKEAIGRRAALVVAAVFS